MAMVETKKEVTALLTKEAISFRKVKLAVKEFKMAILSIKAIIITTLDIRKMPQATGPIPSISLVEATVKTRIETMVTVTTSITIAMVAIIETAAKIHMVETIRSSINHMSADIISKAATLNLVAMVNVVATGIITL